MNAHIGETKRASQTEPEATGALNCLGADFTDADVADCCTVVSGGLVSEHIHQFLRSCE